MGGERRNATRYLADWPARCSFDARPGWRECRILDISAKGAALTVDDATPDEALTGLRLEIASIAGDEAAVAMHASIRRHVRPASGRLIVGIRFSPLTRDAQQLLQLLIGLRAHV